MNPWQADVQAFHEKFGVTVGGFPDLRDKELRAKLILEEAVETVAAMGYMVEAQIFDMNRPDPINHQDIRSIARFDKSYHDSDFPEVIDGLVDVIYVVLGAAVTFGIDLSPYWDEVQRSNMAKDGGATREDGKILKPEGWTPPDIARLLDLERDAATERDLPKEPKMIYAHFPPFDTVSNE